MEEIAQLKIMGKPRMKVPGHLLKRDFFEDSPQLIAPRLLGKLLVHRTGNQVLAGRIVEVEAYLGPHNNPPDPAAHAHRGPTPRNLVLFGPPGHAYVYSIYGRYFCMNVSCEVKGRAGCVLIRALEPIAGAQQMTANRGLGANAPVRKIASGPGRLCQALGLTRLSHNGIDLTDFRSMLQIRSDGQFINVYLVTPRIGIKNAMDWPMRFALHEHHCVSGPRVMIGATQRRNFPSVQ
jgi:DNA-3-methyladenine glycosylase